MTMTTTTATTTTTKGGTREAVGGDCLQHAEKVNSVLRELLEVFVDHGKGALKEGLQDGRDALCRQILQTT